MATTKRVAANGASRLARSRERHKRTSASTRWGCSRTGPALIAVITTADCRLPTADY